MIRKQLTLLAAIAACAPFAAVAQNAAGAIDRTKPPALGTSTKFNLPTVARGTMPNGIALQVVEHHALPLVHVTLVIDGGSRLEAGQPGLAGFTARMLTEGAGTRDANALQSGSPFSARSSMPAPARRRSPCSSTSPSARSRRPST